MGLIQSVMSDWKQWAADMKERMERHSVDSKVTGINQTKKLEHPKWEMEKDASKVSTRSRWKRPLNRSLSP